MCKTRHSSYIASPLSPAFYELFDRPELRFERFQGAFRRIFFVLKIATQQAKRVNFRVDFTPGPYTQPAKHWHRGAPTTHGVIEKHGQGKRRQKQPLFASDKTQCDATEGHRRSIAFEPALDVPFLFQFGDAV